MFFLQLFDSPEEEEPAGTDETDDDQVTVRIINSRWTRNTQNKCNC